MHKNIDKTVEIAEAFGSKVLSRKFDNFSNQKSSTLHQRMALNIPIILKEEANFNSVYEPLNGSHIIEGLCEKISEKS